jgi:hypothetical protein
MSLTGFISWQLETDDAFSNTVCGTDHFSLGDRLKCTVVAAVGTASTI